jgi:hypothetical protein
MLVPVPGHNFSILLSLVQKGASRLIYSTEKTNCSQILNIIQFLYFPGPVRIPTPRSCDVHRPAPPRRRGHLSYSKQVSSQRKER